MYISNRCKDYGYGGSNRSTVSAILRRCPRFLVATLSTLATAVALSLAVPDKAEALDVPSDLPASPDFGALPFSQQLLRFEEFGVHPLPPPGAADRESYTAAHHLYW